MTAATDTFSLAWQYHQANDLPRAEQLYREVLRTTPGHADAWCFLGAICHAQGRWPEAEQHLHRALQLAPDYPTAQNLLGIVLAQQGRHDEATSCFRQLLNRHPEDAEGNSNLGNLLNLQGKHDEAIFHCRRSLQSNPHNPAAHNNLGNGLLQKGKRDEAAASFEAALRLDPNFVESHLNLGAARHGQLRFEEAEAHYRAALRLRPSNKLRVLLACLLPPIYNTLEELQTRRRRLVEDLRQLRREGVVVDLATDESSVDVPALFYLPYQGLNDLDIQRDFASLFRPLQLPPPTPRKPGGKIKIGFLSRFLKDHTIGRLMCGLIANLSREIFDVSVLSIGRHQDALAQRIQ
ncbi:MAG TPA: tetratricopeptide repeat protein, partial [Gemmataceae bacterium]|nr:tetratricopeptide repeat protein [Gemmataceae bacterium]